jgi:hypothetical protein
MKALPVIVTSASFAAFLFLGGCQTVERSAPVAPAARTLPSDPLVGKWGLAAYHRDTDRPRTEKEAHAQCSNAYVIAKGPNGGVMMHLADEKEKTEIVLKSGGGKTYLGPAGEAPLAEDREVLSIEPNVLIMRYMDPDVAARYGTSIYVRCSA